MAALRAGYAVFAYQGPFTREKDMIYLGNGTRMSLKSADLLCQRGFLEVDGKYKYKDYYVATFLQLTDRGLRVAIEQDLWFDPAVITVPMPHWTEHVRVYVNRYRILFGHEPLIEVKANFANTTLGFRWGKYLYPPHWREVVAMTDLSNLVGLRNPDNVDAIIWVRLGYPEGGKMRMRPKKP